MQDCEIPRAKGRLTGHLAENNLALRASLELCNADKAALRQWVQAAKK